MADLGSWLSGDYRLQDTAPEPDQPPIADDED